MPFLHATGKFSMLNRTKMYGFVWTCLTVWMLMKQRQKFFDGYEQLDNLLCQMTMSCNCIQLGQSSFLLLFFVLFYYLITSCVVLLSWWRNKEYLQGGSWREVEASCHVSVACAAVAARRRTDERALQWLTCAVRADRAADARPSRLLLGLSSSSLTPSPAPPTARAVSILST